MLLKVVCAPDVALDRLNPLVSRHFHHPEHVGGRLYRLTRGVDRKVEIYRIKDIEDSAGREVGRYGTRANAMQALKKAAYMYEPKR